MAPSRHASDNNRKDLPPTVQEIIFSCGICQATLPDLYPLRDPSNPKSGSSDDDGLTTRLWIATCTHITCSKHLEGGGAPFTPRDVIPKAACPVCVRENGDSEPKELYAIRGFNAGEYDPIIPKSYFQVPPISFKDDDPESDAIRFQYSHIINYSQHSAKTCRAEKKRRRAVESTLHQERKEVKKLKAEHQELQQRHGRDAAALEQWTKRKEQIKHYMAAVPEMTRDIHQMREELLRMGYDVPKKTYVHQPKQPSQDHTGTANHDHRKNDSSTTLVGDQNRSSSSKRRRLEDEVDASQISLRSHVRGDSSNLMPPPLAPPMRTQHYRPPPVQTASHGLAQQHPPQPGRAIDHEHWQNGEALDAREDVRTRLPSQINRGFEQNTMPENLSQMNIFSTSGQSRAGSHQLDYDQQQPSLQQQWSAGDGYVQSGYTNPQGTRLLSMPPRRRTSRNQVVSETYQDPYQDTAAYSAPSRNRPARVQQDVNYYQENSGSMAKPPAQYMTQMPPTQPPDTTYHDTLQSRGQTMGRPGVQQRALQAPNASVLSPFFKSQADTRPPSIQPERPSHYMSQPTRASQASDVGAFRTSVAPSPRLYRTNPNAPVSSQAMDAPAHERSGQAYQPRQPYNHNFSHYRTTFPPQSSQQDQGTSFARPAPHPPPSIAGSFAPPPSSTKPYRSRVTMPPSSSSRPAFSGSQDPQISMIRGVRGAGVPPSAGYSRQGIAPHNSARNRMIVRR